MSTHHVFMNLAVSIDDKLLQNEAPTEDLQHGQVIDGVTVENPFLT